MPLMHVASFGAPPASFDPTTVAGCKLYLRSDLGVTLSGSIVTAWADQSGNGRNATPVGSPTRVTNVQNGFPSVHLTSGQYFSLASSAMAGQNWTIFAVVIPANVASSPFLYSEDDSVSKFRGMRFAANAMCSTTNDGTHNAQANDTATTVANGTCYVGTATSANGNPVIAYANGDAGTSASSALIGAYTVNEFTVGAAFAGSAFSGDLMALIVYSNVLSSTDRAYVRDGLKTLYAVY